MHAYLILTILLHSASFAIWTEYLTFLYWQNRLVEQNITTILHFYRHES